MHGLLYRKVKKKVRFYLHLSIVDLKCFLSMKQDKSTEVLRVQFLGTFAKLRKATITFVMSVRLSMRVEQLGSQRKDFHEIWYLIIFRKSVHNI
jgi:hypothetical protein